MNLMKLALVVLILCLSGVYFIGCGGESGPAKEINTYSQERAKGYGEPKMPFDPYSLDPDKGVHVRGFSLHVVDESNQPNPEFTRLYEMGRRDFEDGGVILTISVHGSPGIPHSLLYLRYDETELNPVKTNISGFFGEKDEYISLISYNLPGLISLAIARIHPEEGMPTGDGVIATLVFESEPFDETAHKQTAKAPRGDENKVTNLSAIVTQDLKVTLSWREVNVGDYTNDGEITIADVAPIALRYLNIVGDGDDEDHIDRYVDGNRDNSITIADVAPIARNYLTLITGYRVYRTTDLSDPPDFADPYIGSETGPVTLGRADPPENNDRPVYQFTDTDVTPGEEYRYKVVPYDIGDDDEGVDSNYKGVVVEYSELDSTPPEWITGPGIITTVPGDSVIKIAYGYAVDDGSPPVSYILYYEPGAWTGGDDAKVAPLTTNPYYLGVDDPAHPVANGVEYFLLVRALDSANPINETKNTELRQATPAFGSPNDLDPPDWADEVGAYKVENGDGQVRVWFGSATDADSPPVIYRLYWEEGDAGVIRATANKVTIPSESLDDPSSPSYLLSGLTNDQELSILVTARDSAPVANETVNTGFMVAMPLTGGNPDLTPPYWLNGEEAGIKGVAPGNASARVRWYGADDEETPPVTYTVYWEEDTGSEIVNYNAALDAGRFADDIPATQTSLLVEGLDNGTTYRFSVRAADSATSKNTTENTESLTVTPSPGGDTDPPVWSGTVGIQQAAPLNSGALLTWNAAVDAESPPVFYNAYWEADTGSGPIDYLLAAAEGRVLTGISDTSAQIGGLFNGVTYRVGVRAEDAAGNEDENTVSLTVAPDFSDPFTLTTIDDEGDTGYTPTIALAPDGRMGIAYYDQTNGTLKYADNSSGSWTTETVYIPPDIPDSDPPEREVHGPFCDLVFDVDSHPHIAYLDWTRSGASPAGTRMLYITHDGASWQTHEVVDFGELADYDTFYLAPRITLDPDGNPVLTYVDVSNADLKLAKKIGSWQLSSPFKSFYAGNPGALRAEPVYFDAGEGDTLAIAWHDPIDGLSFAYWDGNMGAYVMEVVTGISGEGLHLDLELGLDGEPVIAYQDFPSGRPMLARRIGSDAWDIQQVDSPAPANGSSIALGILDSSGVDIPAVAWFDGNDLGARAWYAIDDLGDPEKFLSRVLIDPAQTNAGFFLSLIIDNEAFSSGRAFIAYTTPNGDDAKLNLAERNP